MRFALFAFFCVCLTACSSRLNTFSLPQQIDFKGESYVVASQSQIGEMQHWLYLPKQGARDPEHWQQGFLLFTDQNNAKLSLQDRLSLRQKAFNQQPKTQATLTIENQELHSAVVYPPIERHPDYQLEVSRGRDLTCGFGQIQYASKRLAKGKILQSALTKELMALAEEMAQLPWLIGCK